MGSVLLANILSPLFANSLVQSYDFDGNGAVSLDELLQDRGQDQIIGAAGSLGAAAVDATIKGIFKTLMGALPAVLGLFGSF